MSTEDSFDPDNLVIALDQVPDRVGPAPLPAGRYNASVESIEYKKSQRSGNPMLEWRFRIEPQEGQERGNVVFWHTVLNHENGLSNLKQAVQALAPELADQPFHPIETSPELQGRECILQLRVRPRDDGSSSNDVSRVFPPEASETGLFS